MGRGCEGVGARSTSGVKLQQMICQTGTQGALCPLTKRYQVNGSAANLKCRGWGSCRKYSWLQLSVQQVMCMTGAHCK